MPEQQSPTQQGEPTETVHRDYVLDVRIVEVRTGGETKYRFEAPQHCEVEFDDPAMAELYADVYFDANGFQEADTGDRGVPPEIVQAGRDTLSAYFLTRPDLDLEWVASYYGKDPAKIERYVDTVRHRANEIRDGVREQGMA